MGDIAEQVFEEVRPLGRFERLGWNRPEVPMSRMSPVLRHMPDYYTETGHLVEVMGCGRDGVVKLKVEKWEAMKWWNKSGNEVALFLWNSATNEWSLLDWSQMVTAVRRARAAGIQAFANDGNRYYPIQWDRLERVRHDV